jgi:glycosyltransferase involved in cell wall biosynthesis
VRVALLHFGFEDYTIELANALVEQVDLTLIQPQKVAATCRNYLDPRIVIRSFQKPRMRDPRTFMSMVEMMRIIREVQPDVLHVQDTCDPWYDFTLLFNQIPPLVTTIHDVFRHPGDREGAFGAEYTHLLSIYRSQQIIVHADALKQVLTQTFRVPSARISVLPHGELGSLYQRRSTGRVVPREPHTLLFFGRIWPYKGLRYLLAAMPLIAERIPDVKLIIAGRGEALERYFPNGYDPNRYEILNDFIPVTEVVGLFQRSALTVLPYTESSQSGVAALSYGLGTPVVASRVGGLSEVIRDGEDGFLVPPRDVHALANAIVNVLRNPELQHRLQSAAVVRCQGDLKWSTIAVQTVEVYQRVIESAQSKHPKVKGHKSGAKHSALY